MQYLTRWSDLCMHFKFEFVHAFQDQANINIQITFFWGEKLIVHIHVTHEDIREFESNYSLQCCHEVRIGKQNVHAYKIYSGKEKKMYT